MSQSKLYQLRKPHAVSETSPVAVDLFSGAGGISLGLANAAFRVVLSSDRDPACAATHRENLPSIPFAECDIRDLSASEVRRRTGLGRGDLDLLIGGPPCQGFSILGERNPSDPRNGLFQEFIRIANGLRPKAIVMENVPGLATLAGGAILREIGAKFAQIGYDVTCAELLAAQYGVPQMRWRLVFIAWPMASRKIGSGFPRPTHGNASIGDLLPNRPLSPEEMAGFLTTFDAIGDLPPTTPGGTASEYLGRPSTSYQRAMRSRLRTQLSNHYAPNLSEQNLRRIDALQPGQDWRDLPMEMLPPGMRRALRKDHTRRYRRMTWGGVPRSIITRFRDPKSGEYIHPEQGRTISIREAARIQSFPDWFRFMGTNSQLYDQVGNAVPPLLAKAIGNALFGALIDADTSVRSPRSRYGEKLRQPGLFSNTG